MGLNRCPRLLNLRLIPCSPWLRLQVHAAGRCEDRRGMRHEHGEQGRPTRFSVWTKGQATQRARVARYELSLSVEGFANCCVAMPAPIPVSSLEGPWRLHGGVAKTQPRQCAVTRITFWYANPGGSIEPVERRVIILTKIVSAVVANTDSVGVYWGEGVLVHKPSEFLERAS